MRHNYSIISQNTTIDFRRLGNERRLTSDKLAARQMRRRYGLSEAHASLIANLHYNKGGAL